MKPIVITIAPNKDGIVQLTMDKLSELLDQAYNAGKADGKDSNFECPYWWRPSIEPTNPLNPPFTPYCNWCNTISTSPPSNTSIQSE